MFYRYFPLILSVLCVVLRTVDSHCAENPANQITDNGNIVARVNGIAVTEQMVLEQIDQIAMRAQGTIPPEHLAQRNLIFFQNGLESAINLALLKSEAVVKGITVETADVNKQINSFKERLGTEENYQKWLSSQGLTEEKIRKNEKLLENLLYQKVVEAGVEKTQPPDEEEMKRFYDENPNIFLQPERSNVSHIMLEMPANSAENDRKALEKKLQTIRADIESEKITFEEAVKQYSQHAGTAANGGNLGYIAKGQEGIPPEFEKAALETPVGKISGVVATPIGLHLIKVLAHDEQQTVPLDDIKETLRQSLHQKKEADATQHYFDSLREKGKIETVMTDEQWNARHTPKPSIKINPDDLKLDN
ncbi:MAG: hypothetical protein C4527_06495 [Candidatus Omnitrophota bacterium]|jgi:parvulin-like peptidyl-prolyl isomerase|nr:MAG: hypothetical protein C4527_06495 [Candidatus Omnitrophota bacterium]